jgi:T5SS/PEP-CTERM-associated repeat protein
MSSNALPPGVSQDLFDSFAPSTMYFDGDGQAGNWGDPNNWWNGLPGADSVVVVPVSATLNGSFAANSVMLLGNETVTINGTVTTQNPNPCEGFMVCDGAAATFTPGSALNDAGALIVGNDGNGTLTALAGVTLGSLDGLIGRMDAGVGALVISDAHWNSVDDVLVGDDGRGALTVTANGVVTVGTNLDIGANHGSRGQVTVSDGGTLAIASLLAVGSNQNSAFGSGTGTLTVAAGGVVTVGFELAVYAGNALTLDGGTIEGGAYATDMRVFSGGFLSGFGTIAMPAGMIADCGTMVATGGTLLLNGILTGANGVLDIAGGATADITGTQITGVSIGFTGAHGVLELANGVIDPGTITGFAAGDEILMSGVNGLSFNASTDILTLGEGNTAVAKLHFDGPYASNAFTLTQTAAGAAITLASRPVAGPATVFRSAPVSNVARPTGLPPGVSQALYSALPGSTIFFDGKGQPGNWSDPNNDWNGPAGADSSIVVPVDATLNGSFGANSVMLLGTETVTINGTLATHNPNDCESFMVCDGAVANFNPGSALNTAGCLIVGNDDDGTLTALGSGSSFATLTSAEGKIGRLDDGAGDVVIAGAHWTNSSVIQVGCDGEGTLTITDDGLVTVGNSMIIGIDAGSTGQVTVSDGGTLAIDAVLSIGNGPGGGAEGAGAGTLTVGAGGLVTFGSELDVYRAETLTMAGGTIEAGAYANGVLVLSGGVLSGFGAISAPSGLIEDCGTIIASGGTLQLNGYVGGSGGVLDIASGATADLTGSSIGQVTIAFTGANGVLDLAAGVTDAGVIADFAAGDAIQMAGVTSLSFNSAKDILTLLQGSTTVDKLDFSGVYASNAFTLTQSNGSALITLAPGH